MILDKFIAIVFLILWIGSILLLNRQKMSFLKFLIGTVGGFVFTLYFGKVFLNKAITFFNLVVMDLLTKSNQSIDVFVNSNAVTVFSKSDALSYFITYECSGLIEMLVFTNILLFYPIFKDNFLKKLSVAVAGNLFIFIANIIRLFFMSYIVIWFGVGSFFIAHVILARLLFIGFNILLYYFVFTLTHIKDQKAGDYTVINEKREGRQIG